jgi:raffinose/stachyose/melibiose transport system permease protein
MWFIVPAATIFSVFFLVPVLISLFFSMTIWNFDSFRFVGFDNFVLFFSERSLAISMKNTVIYAFLSSGLKVVLAFFIAIFLTSRIKSKNFIRSLVFFPNLVSTIAIGMVFKSLLHPTKGFVNTVLGTVGIEGISWLGNPDLALYSVILTDVWKGVSIATVIYIAGIVSIDQTFYEAAAIDGANEWSKLKNITIPLVRPAMNTVILLSLIGGLRSFDLIWAMTGGGPGFASDVLASTIYKQYAAGFYGLSTAGNVIMLVLIGVIAFPLRKLLLQKEMD